MKRVPFVTIALALLLSACAQATPTTDPAMIQASAVAAANTMVALTQAAVPTETPIPPTPLPSPTALPSPTLLALPTLSLTSLPTQQPQTGGNSGGGTGGNNSGDPCQAPLPAKPAGPLVSVHVANTTKGGVVFSLWLTTKTPFGECGYVGASLGSGASTTLTVPEGCFGAGAFVDAPKQHKAFGNGCFKSQANGTITVDSTDIIKFGQ